MKRTHRPCHTDAPPIMLTLIALLLLTVLARPAAADPVTWTLIGVTFGGSGSVSGSFTFDGSQGPYGEITNWSITVSTPSLLTPPSGVTILNPFTFVPTNSASATFPYVNYNVPDETEFITPLNLSQPGTQIQYHLDFIVQDTTPSPPSALSQIGQVLPLTTPQGYFQTFDWTVTATGAGGYSLYTVGITAGSVSSAVPEPSALLLLGPGLAGLWVWGRKKFKDI